jgi:hypothetical protein
LHETVPQATQANRPAGGNSNMYFAGELLAGNEHALRHKYSEESGGQQTANSWASGGFISGFRHLSAALHGLLELRNHGVPWPRAELALVTAAAADAAGKCAADPADSSAAAEACERTGGGVSEDAVQRILHRLEHGAGIREMRGSLVDVLAVHAPGAASAAAAAAAAETAGAALQRGVYFQDVPALALAEDRAFRQSLLAPRDGDAQAVAYFTLGFEYGRCHGYGHSVGGGTVRSSTMGKFNGRAITRGFHPVLRFHDAQGKVRGQRRFSDSQDVPEPAEVREFVARALRPGAEQGEAAPPLMELTPEEEAPSCKLHILLHQLVVPEVSRELYGENYAFLDEKLGRLIRGEDRASELNDQRVDFDYHLMSVGRRAPQLEGRHRRPLRGDDFEVEEPPDGEDGEDGGDGGDGEGYVGAEEGEEEERDEREDDDE